MLNKICEIDLCSQQGQGYFVTFRSIYNIQQLLSDLNQNKIRF